MIWLSYYSIHPHGDWWYWYGSYPLNIALFCYWYVAASRTCMNIWWLGRHLNGWRLRVLKYFEPLLQVDRVVPDCLSLLQQDQLPPPQKKKAVWRSRWYTVYKQRLKKIEDDERAIWVGLHSIKPPSDILAIWALSRSALPWNHPSPSKIPKMHRQGFSENRGPTKKSHGLESRTMSFPSKCLLFQGSN